MIVGYISSFSVAIFLSIFYLGYLVNDIDDYINAKLKKDKKQVEVSYIQKTKENSSILNFNDFVAVEKTENIGDVYISYVYIAYLNSPPNILYSADTNYHLFTRPPPFFC